MCLWDFCRSNLTMSFKLNLPLSCKKHTCVSTNRSVRRFFHSIETEILNYFFLYFIKALYMETIQIRPYLDHDITDFSVST